MLHRVFNRTGGRSVPAAGAYTGVSAVVVGGADNGGGLGLVRSLGAAGIPVIATDQDSAAPALHSRFAHKVAMSSLSGRKFIDELCELGASLRTRPVLFLTTDEVVLEVSRHRADLEQHFRFRLPLHEQLTALMQKSAFQQLAESLGFAVPRSINLRTAGDLARLHELRFPIVVKPSFKTEQYLASGFGRGYRIHSIEQARATCSRMLPILPDLIVQEWIEGPDTELYFCLQYRGASGSAVSFTGRKLSIWPREVGTTASCIGAPEEHEQLRALTDAFFEKTGFVGMGGMEFKRDVRTGQFFLIEPTVGRIDWQEEVATLGGVNIPAVAYLHELGADVEPPQAKASPVIWQDTARHWKAIAHDSRSGRRRKAKIYDAYWRLEDPWPSVVHLYGLLRRNVTRAVGRLAPMGLSSLARHLERTVELAVANEASFDFRSSEYESLYRSSHATAFQCPHWLAGIHDIVMPSIGADSVTITARLRNGRLALVVPLMRRRLFGIHKVEFAAPFPCC
jgi:predicted ATP-grasp superfamily ATP-dependent carboligase